MKLRRRNRASRQHPLADVEAAIARSERAGGEAADTPPRIHNPHGGSRSHFLDPLSPPGDPKPVCNASGAGWADGDGGLKLCGLCPGIWAKQQSSSDESGAST